jgi:hypothetical protein
MQQRFEFTDLIVAVGLCATIVASGVLLMAANGMQIRTVGWGSLAQPIGNQLGSATVVATMTGPQQGGVTSNRLPADRVAVLRAQDAFPRISTTTTFIVASLILISLFTTGLFVFSPRRAGIPQPDSIHRGAAALVPSKLL